jgi:hypothetical protein
MRHLARALLAATVLAVASGGPALAQRDEHRERRDDHREGWRHDRDIHHFGDRDFDAWRGGRWSHVRHGGRFGWWWVVGGQWYFYPQPVYPYPDPYIPPVVRAAPVPGATWYYCANPAGYYPYVARCALPWRPVPAQ